MWNGLRKDNLFDDYSTIQYRIVLVVLRSNFVHVASWNVFLLSMITHGGRGSWKRLNDYVGEILWHSDPSILTFKLTRRPSPSDPEKSMTSGISHG